MEMKTMLILYFEDTFATLVRNINFYVINLDQFYD